MEAIFSSFSGKGHRLVAHRIDEQLQALIGRQVVQALEVIRTGFADNYKLETDSITEAIYYLFSFGCNQSTPGMQAVNLNINMTNSNNKFKRTVAYLVAKYTVLKLQTISVSERWKDKDDVRYWFGFSVYCLMYRFQVDMRKKAYNTIRVVIGAAKIISLVHMVMFLHNGEYPSVLYRVAGCKTVRFCALPHISFFSMISSGACQGWPWSLQLTALHGSQENYVVIFSGEFDTHRLRSASLIISLAPFRVLPRLLQSLWIGRLSDTTCTSTQERC
jgi:hypothetical protein